RAGSLVPAEDDRPRCRLKVTDLRFNQLMRSASSVVVHGDHVPHEGVSVSEQRLGFAVDGKVGFEKRLGVEPDAFNAGEGLETRWEPSRLNAPVEHCPHGRGVLLDIQGGISSTCECVQERIKMRSLDGGCEKITVHLAPASEMALAFGVKPGRTMT